jgi:hypothetical protein
MEAGPPGADYRISPQTARRCLGISSQVVNGPRKGEMTRHVRTRKANESEPRMFCRKTPNRHPNQMHLAVSNADERGDIATQVEQCVHLHRTFVLTEPGPWKDQQTKINRCRIQRIKGLDEVHAERILCIQRPCNGNQYLGKVGKDAPIVRLIGIAQCRAHHSSPKSHVVQLAAHRTQAGFDVAETLAVGQLSKGHRQKLAAAREAPMVRISAITLDALLKLVEGQVIHELGEHSLSGIHPSLSEIRADGFQSVPTLGFPMANSNRKIRVTSYRFNYLLDIPDSPILASAPWFKPTAFQAVRFQHPCWII